MRYNICMYKYLFNNQSLKDLGAYILDFYCPQIRLGIELDGNSHTEKEVTMYDKV